MSLTLENLVPARTALIVIEDEAIRTTKGGIELPDGVEEEFRTATVLLGDLKGASVLYRSYAGQSLPFEHEGRPVKLVYTYDLVGADREIPEAK